MRQLEAKKTPQYVQHFCQWINNEVPEVMKSHIECVRARKAVMPKKLPTPCAGGCEEFTGKEPTIK